MAFINPIAFGQLGGVRGQGPRRTKNLITLTTTIAGERSETFCKSNEPRRHKKGSLRRN